MHLITRQGLAATAPKRWRGQYQVLKLPQSGRRMLAIANALDALPVPPSPDDVDRIIGNSSWTAPPACSECGKRGAPFVIEVGQPPDYHSETAYLCGECIAKAAALAGTL